MSIQSPHRIAKADRLQSSIYGHQVAEHRPPYIRPHRPKTEPIERFSDEQFGFLIDKLLEDWDSPTLSELGLCRAHSITLEELDAITDDADFQRALALVRRIRAKRRHEVEASARAALFDRLLRLVNQTSENTTATKEVRLACKQLTAFMDSEGRADFQSASSGRPDPHSPTPTPPNQTPEGNEIPPDAPSPTPQNHPEPDPTPTPPKSGGVGAAAPTQQPPQTLPKPNPHKPKHPRGTKPRPKPTSR